MIKKSIGFDEENTLSKYFKDVRKSTVLTPDEEVELAKEIQSGNEAAIEKLVNANLKFVVSIAKEYQNQGLSLADLISEGNYGLVKAATRYDHTRGFRFISYAVWWIKQAIIESLNENSRTVRLPTNVISKIYYLKKEIEKFEFQNEREPIFGEIFDKNHEPMELLVYPKCSSLNDVVNEDGDEIIDLISSEQEEEIIIDERIKKQLNKTLAILDEREKDIVECYYGVNKDCEPMTLEAIGEKYKLTKERIRQIKEKALRKLRFSSGDLSNVLSS